jgi:hypothetical protein
VQGFSYSHQLEPDTLASSQVLKREKVPAGEYKQLCQLSLTTKFMRQVPARSTPRDFRSSVVKEDHASLLELQPIILWCGLAKIEGVLMTLENGE